MRSTPTSVSFWTTHSGRCPLVRAKPIVMAGAGASTNSVGPSATNRPGPAVAAGAPVAPTIGHRDLLAGPQP